jgi:N4-gp56 family major capsid protein
MTTQVYGGVDGNSSHGQNTKVHYYDKAGVKSANAVSVYTQFSDRRSMPLKMGKTFKVSKWLHIYDRAPDSGDFAARGYLTARDIIDVSDGLTEAALAEGAGDVNHQSIQKVTIETNFARYGELIPYTDEVEMFSEDMVQVRYREELGLLANQRVEDLVQMDMLGTSNIMYSGVATAADEIGDEATGGNGATDNLSRVSYDLIRRAVRRLVRNRAIRNTEIVTGSTKIDTQTVNKAFYAVIGPEVKYDLESVIRGTVADNGTTQYVYVPAYKYSDATKLAEGEVGKMNDVRFIESESAMTYRGAGGLTGTYTGSLSTTTIDSPARATALGVLTGGTYADGDSRFDVFPILFPTKGSFATVGLKGNGKIKFNSKAPSSIELSNPYGTKGFFSYNLWYSGIILREERLLKILVAASE